MDSGFENVISWLYVERDRYQQKKFDEQYTANPPESFQWWDQQFNSYIQRLGVFPPDSQQYKQAALKLAATAVALCEFLADEGPLPKPGVSSGTIEVWT